MISIILGGLLQLLLLVQFHHLYLQLFFNFPHDLSLSLWYIKQCDFVELEQYLNSPIRFHLDQLLNLLGRVHMINHDPPHHLLDTKCRRLVGISKIWQICSLLLSHIPLLMSLPIVATCAHPYLLILDIKALLFQDTFKCIEKFFPTDSPIMISINHSKSLLSLIDCDDRWFPHQSINIIKEKSELFRIQCPRLINIIPLEYLIDISYKVFLSNLHLIHQIFINNTIIIHEMYDHSHIIQCPLY